MVRFPTQLSDEELIQRAMQVGVGLSSAQPQYMTKTDGHEFILSYSELDEEAIQTGVRRIARLLQSD